MGDKVGRVYVDSQDLGKLQSRKFKGLKRKPGESAGGADAEGDEADASVADASADQGEGRKRRKEA